MTNPPTRIPVGKIFLGPEYYGCMNTGMRPVILHSRFMRDHRNMVRGYRFAIGPEMYVQEAVRKLALGKLPSGQAFAEFDKGKYRVTFARTYATAKRRLAFLSEEVTIWNTAQRTKHQDLLAKAKAGDLRMI